MTRLPAVLAADTADTAAWEVLKASAALVPLPVLLLLQGVEVAAVVATTGTAVSEA